jgi:D-sedoheptulose 7-phosphate isomerase
LGATDMMMIDMRSLIEKSLRDADELLHAFRTDPRMVEAVEKISVCVLDAFRAGKKILACGNGGSMADAMHFCEEWSGRFREDRDPYPAIALSDPTHMSCVANDYGYEHVFSRQVRGLGSEGDVLLLLTTSGNSPSIIEAARAARTQKMRVVGLLGKGGGELLPLCDLALVAPGITSDRIQELHMLCLHVVIEAVEGELKKS